MVRVYFCIALLATSIKVISQNDRNAEAFGERLLAQCSFANRLLDSTYKRPFLYPGGEMVPKMRVAYPPLPFQDGHLLTVYMDDSIQDNSTLYLRRYSFIYLASNGEIAPPPYNIFTTYTQKQKASFTIVQDIFIKYNLGNRTRFFVYEPTSNKIIDFNYLSDAEFRIYRNHIFARYGYEFKSEDLRQHFSKFEWYQPRYKNVDQFLTADDKAIIAAIQKYEAGVHYYKALAAPGLPDLFTASGKEMPPSVARFFFPQVSDEFDYTATWPAVPVKDGYVLALTRAQKPSLEGNLIRVHSFVFWKDGVAGLPAPFETESWRGSNLHPQEVTPIQDCFLFVALALGPGDENVWPRAHFYVISGQDIFEIERTPKAEIEYYKNYLLARLGSAFKTSPDVRATFEKFDWYKPGPVDIDYSGLKGLEQSIYRELELELQRRK